MNEKKYPGDPHFIVVFDNAKPLFGEDVGPYERGAN